jgi:NAD-dependent SIR2 family protein deacetylase
MSLSSPLELAARAIAAADALVITAGAGMGVDSGLPDFRGQTGFWKAYPPLAKLGLNFEQMANATLFERDPALAWGFYGHRLNLYRRTPPHAGFAELLRWVGAKRGGGFVFTSNVDGQFQRAGFAPEQVAECHGSIHHFQCTAQCRGAIWAAPTQLGFTVDAATCRSAGDLPRCPHCGALARPNILMFLDSSWVSSRSDAQERAFDHWLMTGERGQLTILEFGAGTALSTVRRRGESLQQEGATLVRINPRESSGPTGTTSLAAGALAAITGLAKFGAGR